MRERAGLPLTFRRCGFRYLLLREMARPLRRGRRLGGPPTHDHARPRAIRESPLRGNAPTAVAPSSARRRGNLRPSAPSGKSAASPTNVILSAGACAEVEGSEKDSSTPLRLNDRLQVMLSFGVAHALPSRRLCGTHRDISPPRGGGKSTPGSNPLLLQRLPRRRWPGRPRIKNPRGFEPRGSETCLCYFTVTETMWGLGPSYQYRKPTRSILSPTCRVLTVS